MLDQPAAQRFVNYWEGRRDAFGHEKYVMRMSLSEALRDDLLALQAGVVRLLPHKDLSGRHLLLLEAARNTREGYTWQSLVSCFQFRKYMHHVELLALV